MTDDPWWWGAVGGAVGAGAALREFVKISRILFGRAHATRRSNVEVDTELRDALLDEITRLRSRIESLEQRADHLQEQLVTCEERSRRLQNENDDLATRIMRLERRSHEGDVAC